MGGNTQKLEINDSIDSNLKGVPETMLWTLHNRAVEAMRPDGIISDPWCIQIYKSVNYDFKKNFGKAEPSHAIRSNVFDHQIKSFLKKYPEGLVIALGEGLETQVLRCDNGHNRWLSVDLPEAIELRKKCFAPNPRYDYLSKSALDFSWLDHVADEPVFIVIQGLLMYFTEDQVQELLQKIDKKFSAYAIMFDTIPHWFSKMTMKGFKKTADYTAPKMPWEISINEIPLKIRQWLPEIQDIEIFRYKFPRGFLKYFGAATELIPGLKNSAPGMALCRKNIELK